MNADDCKPRELPAIIPTISLRDHRPESGMLDRVLGDPGKEAERVRREFAAAGLVARPHHA